LQLPLFLFLFFPQHKQSPWMTSQPAIEKHFPPARG
jgi:hypothetical protein